jgi:hypothetical protein
MNAAGFHTTVARITGKDGDVFTISLPESEPMAAHRNRLESNLIENNGVEQPGAGIRVRGATHDPIFNANVIRDPREARECRQEIGICLEERRRCRTRGK